MIYIKMAFIVDPWIPRVLYRNSLCWVHILFGYINYSIGRNDILSARQPPFKKMKGKGEAILIEV
jgi:hypothetical protein